MNLGSIKKHLQPYRIASRRTTTINHAFASAIAPVDVFDLERVRTAIRVLGQDPDGPLRCVYCDTSAETWDHLQGLVMRGEFSGFGHVLGNLVPCCKACNSTKGNKPWRIHLAAVSTGEEFGKRSAAIEAYACAFIASPLASADYLAKCPDEMRQLGAIRSEILALLARADAIAASVRDAVASARGVPMEVTATAHDR